MKTRFFLFVSLSSAVLCLTARIGAVHAAPANSAGARLSHPVMQIAAEDWEHHHFRVSSTTFQNNGEIPLIMVYGGCGGGDQSPELSWTHAPHDTRSFAVAMFDVTANFTHWGMYNISSDATGLPANAGVAGSSYGEQITNDFGNIQYDGPCPPPGLVHHYVVTIYAVDTDLHLPSSSQFPANAETLFRALIGHVIESASITGLYSTK